MINFLEGADMARGVPRDQARKFLFGLVAVVLGSAIAYIGATVQTGGELPLKSYTHVTAVFNDAKGLKGQENVVQNGIRIGLVESVEYRADDSALVTMRLDGDRHVYRDARATISNVAALGRRQVQLNPGNPGAGLLGQQPIPKSQTTSVDGLDEVWSMFDRPTRQGLRTSLLNLGGGIAGHSSDLRDVSRAAPNLLADLGTVTRTLAGERTDLPALLESANRLAGRFEQRQDELRALVRQLGTTFDAVAVDGGRPLGDTVRALPATLRQARQGLEALNRPLADIRTAMTNVRPGARALGTATADLRGFLRESVRPLGKVPAVGKEAVPAVKDLTVTVADARPLVPRLVNAVADARVLLHGLSPYAPDIGRLFSGHDLLSGRIAPDQHFFSGMLTMPGLASASLPDPMVYTRPYPEPGRGPDQLDEGTQHNQQDSVARGEK